MAASRRLVVANKQDRGREGLTANSLRLYIHAGELAGVTDRGSLKSGRDHADDLWVLGFNAANYGIVALTRGDANLLRVQILNLFVI